MNLLKGDSEMPPVLYSVHKKKYNMHEYFLARRNKLKVTECNSHNVANDAAHRLLNWGGLNVIITVCIVFVYVCNGMVIKTEKKHIGIFFFYIILI